MKMAPRLKEVGRGIGPYALVHVHLAAALADDAHHARVRNGALDAQRARVQLLKALVVALLRGYLDLQRIHLQQLGALFQVVASLLTLT